MSDLVKGILLGAGVFAACALVAVLIVRGRLNPRALVRWLRGGTPYALLVAVLVVGVVLGATLQWFFFTPSYQEVSVPKKAYLAVLVEQKEIPPRCNGLIDALTSWLRNDDGTVDLQEFNDLIDQAWVSVRCKE